MPCVAQAATITVTTNAATGPGSLADAIDQANVLVGTSDTIAFNLPGSTIISVVAPGLPVITSPVIVDGRSQPGFATVPLVQLVGCKSDQPTCTAVTANGANATGLEFAQGAAGSRISALSIVRFDKGGIVVGAPNTTVTGNYVGVDLGGVSPGRGNGKGGVVVKASGAVVGGTTAADRNVIGDNHELCGVDVTAGSGTVVRGNYIGTDATGDAGVGNQSLPSEAPSCGVRVEGSAAQTVIGGGGAAGNVISGNDRNGLEIVGGATDTVVQGNRIGLAADNSVLGNVRSGVLVAGGSGTTIGGTSPSARNFLSGNFNRAGVEVTGGTVSVQGNYVGLDPDGVTPRSNLIGALVAGGKATIGGAGAARNLISGNYSDGVRIDSGASGTVVRGNQIGGGVGANASVSANGGAQVRVSGTASGNLIGGLGAGEDNMVIDVSDKGSIVLDGSGLGNTVRGNIVRIGGLGHPRAIDRFAGRVSAPILGAVFTSGSRTQVTGLFLGTPNTTYDVDVYADAQCSETHRGIDSSFGSGVVTTDADGNGNVSFPIDAPPPTGLLLATVTDPAGTTSEIGDCGSDPMPAPTLQLSAAAYTAPESARSVPVKIIRTGGGPASAGIRLRTSDGTARAGSDYTPLTIYRTVNAPPEEQSTVVDIPIADDGVQAGNRTFSVDLYEPNTAVQGPLVHATVTIVDDTPAPKPPVTTPTTPVGPPKVVSPATVTIASPHGTVRRAKVKSISGKSKSIKAAKVRRIEVAVTRTVKCERLSTSGRLLRAKASLRKTCPPSWLRASGTTSWRYRLKRTLPAGTYRISVRAFDVLGHAGKVRSATVRLR